MSSEPSETGPVEQPAVDPSDAQTVDAQPVDAPPVDAPPVDAQATAEPDPALADEPTAEADPAGADEPTPEAEAEATPEAGTVAAEAEPAGAVVEPATVKVEPAVVEVEPAAESPAETPAETPGPERALEVTPEPQAAAPPVGTQGTEPVETVSDAAPTDAAPTDAAPTDAAPTDAGPALPGAPDPVTPAVRAPTPAAVPRPSVRPGRGPAPTPPAAVTPPLAVGAAAFGRVDEAGTVHVRDGETEREVGQYPDVPEAEALAFYVRKFEDLAGQVHLLGQRLDNGTVPAKEARAALGGLREQATDAKVVGDLPALRAELDRLDGLVAERTAAEDAQRAQARAQALAEREAIVAEAEQIAATPPASMHFKNAGERMQQLLDTWKTAQRSGTRLDKRTEDPLWKRFAAARSTVDRLRRAHFSQVSEQRSGTKHEKESIIERAEELQTSTDWRATSEEYRSLMDRWKTAGRLARKDDDALWARFRAAQDVFFAHRTAANSAQDEEYRGNLAVKEALAAEAEALLPVTDLAAAKRALSSVQDRWDEAGRVPRDSLDRIEGRLRAVVEKVRDADSARWGKSTPDVVQRGSGLVIQLRQQVSDLDAKIAEAEARGDTRTAQRAAKERDTKRAWLAQAQSSLDDLSR